MTAAWRVAKVLGFILLIPCSAAVFASGFAHGFLPSPAWVSATNPIRVAIGLVFIFVALKIQFERRKDRETRALAVVIMTIAAYIFSSASIVGTSILFAIFAGDKVEIPFLVEKANGTDRRGCASLLDLTGLPYSYGTLCGVSEEFRQTLGTGTKIIVVGRGTAYGVYASDYRRMQP